MPTPHVTLHEVLSALGGPLEEKTLWALLYQGARALREEEKGLDGGPRLLITPETVLLHPGGSIHLLPGIQEHSSFTAPELFSEEAAVMGREAMEKSYVYSFGMTLFTAMENGLENGKAPLVSDQLHSVLVGMIEDSLEQRLSLDQISAACQKHIGEVEEEVDQLVTYVLGTNLDLSSSDYGDLEDDANLESELNEAMQMHPTGSVEQLHSPSYGSRTGSSLSLTSKGSSFHGSGNLQRNASFRSVGHTGSRENLSSLPPLYYSGGSQDRLNTMQGRRWPRWTSHDRLSLHIQPQELEILAAKGRGTGRQLPPEPTHLTHLCTPVRPRKLEGVAISRKPQQVDIRRSASFTSEYRPLSGTAPLGVGLEFLRTTSGGRPHESKTSCLSESDQDSDILPARALPPHCPPSTPPPSPPPSTPPPSPPPSTPPPSSPPSTPPPSPPPSTPPPSTPPPSSPPSTPPPSTPPPSTLPPDTPSSDIPPSGTPIPGTHPPDEETPSLLTIEQQVEEAGKPLLSGPANPLEGVGPTGLLEQQTEPPAAHGGRTNIEMDSAVTYEVVKDQAVIEDTRTCENAPTLSLTFDDMPSLPPRLDPFNPPPNVQDGEGRPSLVKISQGLPSLDKIDSILQSVGRRRSSSESDILELPQTSTLMTASSLPNVTEAAHTSLTPPTAVKIMDSVEALEETDAQSTEGPVREGTKEADPTTVIVLQDYGPGTPPTPQRPPPMPDSEPPMFTPYRPMEATSSGSPSHTSKSSPNDTTFDYSGLAEPATSKSEVEDDFDFLAPDCPPPAPPLDASTRLTPLSSPPPLPASSPPGMDSTLVEETAVVAPSEVLESKPTEEMFTKLMDEDSLILGSTASRGRNMGKRITLDEAFKQLDTDGLGDDNCSDEELDPTYATVSSRPTSENKAPPTPNRDVETSSDVFPPETSPVEVKDVSELYAKVNKPQLHRATRIETWPRSFPDDRLQAYATVEIPEEGDMPVYAKVDKSRKLRHTVGISPEEADTERFSFGKVVPKAASVGDVHAVQYAEVDGPKRSSMIEHQYHAVTTQVGTPPAPPSRAAVGPFEVTFDEDWERLQENEKSLKKLENMFGPEFAHLSGRAKKAPDTKQLSKQPEGRRVVRVVLLNGRSVNFFVEHDSDCRELFQQVVSYQSLGENHHFGLAVVRDRDEWFLDFDRKLAKYAPPGWATTPVPTNPSRTPGFTVFFRVKFYVENVSMLRLSQTRHQYYLQLRKDLLEGKTYCHEQPALKLAAFALQAERGDYSSLPTQHNYFRPEDYLSTKVIFKLSQQYVCEVLPDMHAEQQGLSREEAELGFLKEAQKLPEYGMVFYRVANEKHGDIGTVWLGFCVRGIVVYDVHKEVKTPIHHCPWRKTQNLSFANRKLLVELQGEEQPLVFYTGSYKKARYLLHLSISYHRFQLYTRGLLTAESLSASIHQQVTVASDSSDHESQTSPKKGSFGPSSEAPVELVDSNISEIRLLKEPVKGLGIRIADRPGPDGSSVIVIDDITKEGPAHVDGKLKKGDILLSVDGRSLKGLSHREAADVLRDAPSLVKLTVNRGTERQSSIPLPLTVGPLTPLPNAKQEEIQVVVEQEAPPALPSQPSRPPTISKSTTMERESRPFTPTSSPNPLSPTPMEWLTVHLQRGENGSFGFAIAGNSGDASAGVLVRKVTEGGAADGRLQVRDRLLSIDGKPIDALTYSEVLSLIQSSEASLEIGLQRKASPAPTMHIDNLPKGHSFLVELHKRDGALGLRIAGGKDKKTGAGFICIKYLNEGSPAAQCGRLRKGDIILQVNDESLVGVSHRQAADVLLSSLERVCLHIHRASDPTWSQQYSLGSTPSMDEGGPGEEILVSPILEQPVFEEEESFDHPPEDQPPPPPQSLLELAEEGEPLVCVSEPNLLMAVGESEEGLSGARSEPNLLDRETGGGSEVETETITLKKGLRGFGFKIDKARSGQKGHGLYVLSVDNNPAKSDGRLRPGDEVIEVNGMSLVDQPRQQAVRLLKDVLQVGTLIVRRNFGEETREEGQENVESLKKEVRVELSDAVSTNGVQPKSTSELIQQESVLVSTPSRPMFHIPPPPTSLPPPSSPPTTPPPSPPPFPPPKPLTEQPTGDPELVEPQSVELEFVKPEAMEQKLMEPESVEPAAVESESAQLEIVLPPEQDRGTEMPPRPTTPLPDISESEPLNEDAVKTEEQLELQLPPLPPTPLPDEEEPLLEEDKSLPAEVQFLSDEDQLLPDHPGGILPMVHERAAEVAVATMTLQEASPPLPSSPPPDIPEEDLANGYKNEAETEAVELEGQLELPAEDQLLSDEDHPLSDQPGRVTTMALQEASPPPPSSPPPDIPEEDLANGYKSEEETEAVELEVQLQLPPHPSTPPPKELPGIPPPPTSPLPDEDQLPHITKKGRLTEERVTEISLEMEAQDEEATSVPSTPPPPEDQPNGEAQLERSSLEEMDQPPISAYLPPENSVMEPQEAHTFNSRPSLASIVSLEGSLKLTDSEESLGLPQHV